MIRLNKNELINKLEKCKNELSGKLLEYIDMIPKISSSIDDVKQDIDNLINDLRELPRICVIGNTGVGKSSFINHLLGAKFAPTNAVWSQTEYCKSYKYPIENDSICEIIDTRGLGEVFKTDESEKQLFKDLTDNRPHLIIYVLDINSRANINRELKFLKQTLDFCKQKYKREVGCLILANKVDGISPTIVKLDYINDYHNLSINSELLKKCNINKELYEAKINNINEKINILNYILKQEELNIGRNNKITILPMGLRWDDEKVFFWNKKEIIEELFNQSPENVLLAWAELFSNSKEVNDFIENIADRIIEYFSELSSKIGLNPTPVPDCFLLIPIQESMLEILEILKLSENRISAKLFMALAGGPIVQGGKALANYLLKLTGWGVVINAGVAGGFTYILGQAAKAYYIKGMDENYVKEYLKTAGKDKSIKEKYNIE